MGKTLDIFGIDWEASRNFMVVWAYIGTEWDRYENIMTEWDTLSQLMTLWDIVDWETLRPFSTNWDTWRHIRTQGDVKLFIHLSAFF